MLWDNWGDERGCDEGHWHAHTRGLPWGLPEVVRMVQQVHCSRRILLWRGIEFHVCIIDKSAHTKKVGKFIYGPRIVERVYACCTWLGWHCSLWTQAWSVWKAIIAWCWSLLHAIGCTFLCPTFSCWIALSIGSGDQYHSLWLVSIIFVANETWVWNLPSAYFLFLFQKDAVPFCHRSDHLSEL